MPTHIARARLHAARCRCVLTVLYLGGLRPAELAGAPWRVLLSARRHGRGALVAVSERQEQQDPTGPTSDKLIAEPARYRHAHGPAPIPQPWGRRARWCCR